MRGETRIKGHAGVVGQAKKDLKSAFLAVKWPLWDKKGGFDKQYQLVMLKNPILLL